MQATATSVRNAIGGTLLLVAAAAALAVTIAHAAISPVTFRAPDVLATAGRAPSVAASATSRVTVAFTDLKQSRGILVRDLELGGWTQPQLVPGSADGEDPQLAMAPNGATVVAWLVQHGSKRSGMVGVSYRAPKSTTFGAATYLGTREGGASNEAVAVAINDAGRSVVAWTHASSTVRSWQAAFGTANRWGAVQTVEGLSGSVTASGGSVAIDAAGRAITLYGSFNDVPDASSEVRQALAPAGGSFGTPTTVEARAYGENNVDNNLQVRSNAAGQVIAGWGAVCDCVELAFAKAGTGTTTSGITASRGVSNPNTSLDPTTGPERKAGGITQVAIDAAGNGTMVWDASVAQLEPAYDYWAVHTGPDGSIGPSTKFGTNTEAVAGELEVQAADGRVLATWISAPSAGTDPTLYASQVVHPGGPLAAAWSAPVGIVNDADTPVLAMTGTGTAVAAYRFNGASVRAVTNALRDVTDPTLTVPRPGTSVTARSGPVRIPVGCPRTEAECIVGMTLQVRRGAKLVTVAKGSAIVDGGNSGIVPVTFTRSGKALMPIGASEVVTATIKVVDAAQNSRTYTRRWSLMRAG